MTITPDELARLSNFFKTDTDSRCICVDDWVLCAKCVIEEIDGHCETNSRLVFEELVRDHSLVSAPDHGNEYAIVCHYKDVAEKAEEKLAVAREALEFIKRHDLMCPSCNARVPLPHSEHARLCLAKLDDKQETE
jgi:hypothetical protein